MAKVPRLIGCEAAYYFPQDIDICHAPEEGARDRNESRGGELEEGGAGAAGGAVDTLQENKEGGSRGAGNLVIHIRSGDIFEYSTLTGYGQVRERKFRKMCLSLPFCEAGTISKTSRGGAGGAAGSKPHI